MAIEHSLEVFRDQVEFEIDQIAGARRIEIRLRLCMRNDPNRKTSLGHFGHRQADSVDGDRAFRGDVVRKLGRQFYLYSLVRAGFFRRQNARGTIHMALHKMPSKTRADSNSAFKIDAAPAAQVLQVCAAESFIEKIEVNLLIVMGHDRQAATVYCDAVADSGLLCDVWRDDLKLRAPVSWMNPEDAADFFNQAGKHELLFTD